MTRCLPSGRFTIKRDDSVFLHHILDAARKAFSFIQNRRREDLDENEMLALSLVRLLEVIGEAGNSVSSDFREKHPKIPWKKMAEMRNRLIHGYFDVDYSIVWDTVANDLPLLIAELEGIIKN